MYQFTKLLLFCGFFTIQFYGTNSEIFVRYTKPYEIKCDFDELKYPVSWILNNVTAFSCDVPYRAGECKIQDTNYQYTIDYESKKMAVRVDEDDIRRWKEYGDQWTCQHGDEEETYIFDETESPQVIPLGMPEGVLNPQSTASITVGINSTSPYTITWSSKRRGVIKTEEFKERINNASLDVQLTCVDNIDTFTYLVDNGASFPVDESFHLKVRCETIVLEDEMNKTIEVELGQDAVFNVLFAGDKEPTNITWYRRMSSMLTDLQFLTDYRIEKTSQPHSMGMIIHSVQKQDVGTYTAELYSEIKKTLIDFELVIKSNDPDPPFSWYVGIAIGAVTAILVCIVIFIAVLMIRKIKFNDDNYLTPKSVPQTPPPPPPAPHNTDTNGSSTSNYNDSAFYDTDNYENL